MIGWIKKIFKEEEQCRVEQVLERRQEPLERFILAQEDMYERALSEVKNGLKVTHWIWYIFPQLKGLGESYNSRYYGIVDVEEAKTYLNHPILGVRLREITTALLNLNWINPDDVFGRLDAMKVRSCMTLFNEVAEDDLFAMILKKHYQGKKDKMTLNLLDLRMEKLLLGAIAGDVIGSVYEFQPHKATDFPLFSVSSNYTDDTVMTVANAEWLLTGNNLVRIMQDYGKLYPDAGYGGMFYSWLYQKEPKPYNSWGNGSAMRVSPIGWAFDTLEETLEAAKQSAEVTHNHPEGIKGAQVVAACIYLSRKGKSKQEIKEYVEYTFGYNLSRTCDDIRKTYRFNESCQGTVPESIVAFLESTDFESAIRLTVSLGGDADTMGAITGSIAEAYYGGVPKWIRVEILQRLPYEFIDTLQKFGHKFMKN